jgi:tetratricopeptide (TPR) repeat protein
MRRSILALSIAAALFAASPAVRSQEAVDGNALIAFLKGVYLESENDLYNAYQYYLYAAARDPKGTQILLRLAKVAVSIGDYGSAKKHAEALIARNACGTEARIILAEAEYRLGNKDRALKFLMELRNDAGAPLFQVLKFIAKINLDLKRPDEARRILAEASGLPDADFYVFYELGLLAADAGKSRQALEALGKAIEIDPDFTNAHLARARIFIDADSVPEAEREYREALRIEPFNREALSGLADILYASGEYGGGIELFAPLYREGKLDEGGQIIYGRFLYKAGQIDSALSVFEGLIQSMGEKPPLLRVVSDIEIERGHFKTALKYLKRLIEIEPNRFENYVGLMLMIYRVSEEPSSPTEELILPEEEQRRYLEKAEKLVDAGSVEHHLLMGSMLRKAGQAQRAERYLLRAEELDPVDSNVQLELATLFGHEGRYDEALRRIIPLYQKNPEDVSLANFYGYLLAEKGDSLDVAERLLGKALAKEPQNGYFLDSLGWIKFKKGQFREALDLLLGAADKVSDDAVIWEHIGDTYLKLNESEHALEAYRKSLAIDPRSARVDDKVRKLEAGERDAE